MPGASGQSARTDPQTAHCLRHGQSEEGAGAKQSEHRYDGGAAAALLTHPVFAQFGHTPINVRGGHHVNAAAMSDVRKYLKAEDWNVLRVPGSN